MLPELMKNNQYLLKKGLLDNFPSASTNFIVTVSVSPRFKEIESGSKTYLRVSLFFSDLFCAKREKALSVRMNKNLIMVEVTKELNKGH